MEQKQRTKKYVDFKKEKTFGDLIGMPFAFFFQEFKTFSIALLKYAGPFVALTILILGLMTNSFVDMFKFSSEPEPAFFISIFSAIFVFNLGLLAIVTVTYSYASVYETYGKGNFTIDDVGKLLKKSVFKIFGGGILLGLMMIPVMLLAIIPVLGILLIFVGTIFLSVALSFFAIIIVHEDAGIGEAISKSFKLIKGYWWKTFGLYVIFYFIIAFSSYALLIPIYIIIFAAAFAGGGASFGVGAIIMTVFFAIVYFIGYMFLMTLQQFLIAFQYFNLRVLKDGVSLTDRISAINEETTEVESKSDIFEVVENEEKKAESDNSQEPEGENEISENKPDEEEEKPKVEDEWSKLLEEKQKKNRFEDGDENDRFKPKF